MNENRSDQVWQSWAAGLSLLGVLAIGTCAGSLIDPDEGRYAAIPAAMVRSGDWVVPRLNGLPYAEKPPAIYWVTGASMLLFGQNDFAVRIPAALMTVATALWAGRVAAGLHGKRAGVLALLLYVASPLVLILARSPLPDLPLTLGISLCLGVSALAASGRRTRFDDLIFCGGLSLAFLAKGPISLILGIPPLLLGRRAVLGPARAFVTLRSCALFALAVVPWFWIMALRVPGFLEFFFWREHVDRFLATGEHKPHGLDLPTFLLVEILLCLPWGALALVRGGEVPPGSVKSSIRWLLLSWFLTPFVLFLFSRSRLITYLLPAAPAMAILASGGMTRLLESGEPIGNSPAWRLTRYTVLGLGLNLLLLGGLVAFAMPSQLQDLNESLATYSAQLQPVHGMAVAFVGFTFMLASRVLGKFPRRGVVCVTAAFCLAAGTGNWLVSRLSPLLSTKSVAAAFGGCSDLPVVNVGRLRQSLEFYTRGPVRQFAGRGELEFGSRFDEKRVLLRSLADLEALVALKNGAYIVSGEGYKQRIEEALNRSVQWVAGKGQNQLFLVGGPRN